MTITDVTPYGYLRHDPAESSTLGGIPLNGTDEDGCQWWCDVPEGWEAPAAQTPVDGRSWGDGGYAGPTSFEPRALTFGSGSSGVCVAPDRNTARRALRRLLAVASSRGEVTYTAPDYDGPWMLRLRASGQPKIAWQDERVFTFSFVMVAEDPLKVNADELSAAEERNTTGLPEPRGGTTFPTLFPTRFGSGSGSGGTLLIDNRGDEPAQAVYRLTGPVPTDANPEPAPVLRPQVLNTTTGQWFSLTRDLGVGDVAEVDTRAATVYLNGVSIFTDHRGSFPLLAEGPNTIRWTVEGGAYDPTPTLTVITASTRK